MIFLKKIVPFDLKSYIPTLFLVANWLSFLALLVFFILGKYTSDPLKINAAFVLINCIFYKNIKFNKIKAIQNALNNSALKIFNWIFLNPWLFGGIIFIVFILSYGLKGLYITESSGYDTGFFLQALANPYTDGIWQMRTIEEKSSFFLNHFEPFLFFLYPLKFLPYPAFFLYSLGYISITLCFIAGIKFINKHFQYSIEFKMALLLMSSASIFWFGLTSFEFHEVNFIPFLYLMIFISWYEKKFLNFIIFCFFSLLIKEVITITFMWSGLFLLLFSKKSEKKYGIIMLLLGLIFYILYFKLILTALKGNSNSQFLGYYANLGSSVIEILFSPFLKPKVFFMSLVNFYNIYYVLILIAPVLFFIKKGWKALIFLLPAVLMSILPNKENLNNFRNHYGAEYLIPLAICAFYGLKSKIEEGHLLCQKQSCHYFILSYSLAVFLFFLQINPIRGFKDFISSKENLSFTYIIQKIPIADSVVTNSEYVFPFISTKNHMHLYQNYLKMPDDEKKLIKHFVIKSANLKEIQLPISVKLVAKYNDFYYFQVL